MAGLGIEEGSSMRVMDGRTGEILVTRDSVGRTVDVWIAGSEPDGGTTIRLSREEARRLAALILFQESRLDRADRGWASHPLEDQRRSA